jgi:hypothetical protein
MSCLRLSLCNVTHKTSVVVQRNEGGETLGQGDLTQVLTLTPVRLPPDRPLPPPLPLAKMCHPGPVFGQH